MGLNYKFLLCFIIGYFSKGLMSAQTTIVRWDFNSISGTVNPAIGSGTAILIGETSATFKSGNSTDPIGSTSASNFAWNTSSYSPAGTGNKQSGVQFNLSTIGYKGIVFKFDQRMSNTANNSYMVQYTVDRTASPTIWVDAQLFTFVPAASTSTSPTGEKWYNGRTVDLSTVAGLDDNMNVAIRIVSAFDPITATYLSASSDFTYRTSGTVRYDMVTFTANSSFLGLNEENKIQNSFSFYPNPTNGNFIYFDRTVSVRVFDMVGKTIMNARDIKELNLESLSSGIYFIENEDKMVIKMIRN